MLPLAVALAASPETRSVEVTCAGRDGCEPVAHHDAGKNAEVHPLHVVQLSVPPTPDQTRCEPEEWHLVRFQGDQVVDHRLLLDLCNDGYGASGVGDDRVEIGPNRLVHEQMGGSSWRWSQGRSEQLSPPKGGVERHLDQPHRPRNHHPLELGEPVRLGDVGAHRLRRPRCPRCP